MPSTYFIDFVAYVNERIRPEGFPHEVHMQETFDNIESQHHLQAVVNKRFVDLVTSAGLVVLKNPSDIIDSGILTFDKRMFVPWHLLTHMTVSVKLISAPYSPQDSLIPGNLENEKPKPTIQ